MPVSAIAALLYPFFLIPGLIFLSRVETHLPRRGRSVFRETATVIFASVGAAMVVLLSYLGISLVWRLPIDSLVAFVADPAKAFDARPRAVIVWMVIFLALGSVVAWAAASRFIFDGVRRLLWVGSGGDVQDNTAWDRVLTPEELDDDVIVGIQLKSGIWVQGEHDAHSDVAEENGDRQLILRKPLSYRLKDDNSLEGLDPFDRLVVQASEIDYLVTLDRRPASS